MIWQVDPLTIRSPRSATSPESDFRSQISRNAIYLYLIFQLVFIYLNLLSIHPASPIENITFLIQYILTQVMSTRPNATTLLDLPPELRRDIFLKLFRPVTIHRDNHALAILQVCRQIYHEAVPLALPNVRVHCYGNVEVIDTLSRMDPAQITRLRHLILSHSPIGFKLCPDAGYSQPGATDGNLHEDHDSDGSNASDWSDDDGVRYFHLGAVLALFPGLQLDLLEVFCGVSGSGYTGLQTTDCFGSLLEADGYQRLWMEASAGDGGAWESIPSTWKWKDSIMTKFKPYTEWIVRIKQRDWDWDGFDKFGLWDRAQNAGFTLVQGLQDLDDEETLTEDGHESEDTADIIVNRGDADFVVKPDDNRVLRCIEQGAHDESPTFFKRASDALKKLFKVNSWETIIAMDGFDDGWLDDWHTGDIVYAKTDRLW